MNTGNLATLIQAIIAPVVMVTASAILVGGCLQRYSEISSRMRALTSERLDLLRGVDAEPARADALTAERFHQIDRQLPELLRRHNRVRHAVVALYLSVLVFVVSMFVIALARLAPASKLVVDVALLVFLAGTAVMLVGVVLTAMEVRISHLTVQYEVDRVLRLGA
jgi:polyferredoxin